jgi:hypothetical protein
MGGKGSLYEMGQKVTITKKTQSNKKSLWYYGPKALLAAGREQSITQQQK